LRRLNRERRRRGLIFPLRLGTAGARLFLVLVTALVGLGIALTAALRYIEPVQSGDQIPVSRFYQLAQAGQIRTAFFHDFDHRVLGTYSSVSPTKSGTAPAAPGQAVAFWTTYPSTDAVTPLLFQRLIDTGTEFAFVRQTEKSTVQFMAQYVLPLLILANLFGLILLATRGGDSLAGLVQFGRIGGRRRGGASGTNVTFADVGGADEALTELREVRDYLSGPARFAAMGARPPKGVLLFGPPGCGKTLLARAIAGEADVPFFSISGAEFVESLVGIGAARVRDLFRQVRAVAPAIVFIDELDAAGRKRGGVTGGQEEREQTLNQLLVEMDGFDAAEGIVVMGATNRPDILDPALLRPGRFDRQITIDPPDLDGRRDILALHARRRPLAPDVDFGALAERTPGFTGADLANVINEAALLTVRTGKAEIAMPELDEAVLRVMSGPQRRGHLLTSEERERVALHESGHAVVTAAVGRVTDLHRLSIMAREHSLGQSTLSRRMRERAVLTRSELLDELAITMGGVAAEELILDQPSTGARHDLMRATELAQLMMGVYGMSPAVGKVALLRAEGSGFLGETMLPGELATEPSLEQLHTEVRAVLAHAQTTATDILARHRDELTALADRLATVETLDGIELVAALAAVSPTDGVLPTTTAVLDVDGPVPAA
jgi:cell division protease FtsH